MDATSYLAIAENRSVVLEIAREVVCRVAPDEEPVALGFLVPLLEMAISDEVIVVEASDRAGGFGTIDLISVVVVPLLVTALQRVFDRTRAESVSRIPTGPIGLGVTADDVRRLARRCRSRRARRLAKEIAAAADAAWGDVRSRSAEAATTPREIDGEGRS